MSLVTVNSARPLGMLLQTVTERQRATIKALRDIESVFRFRDRRAKFLFHLHEELEEHFWGVSPEELSRICAFIDWYMFGGVEPRICDTHKHTILMTCQRLVSSEHLAPGTFPGQAVAA